MTIINNSNESYRKVDDLIPKAGNAAEACRRLNVKYAAYTSYKKRERERLLKQGKTPSDAPVVRRRYRKSKPEIIPLKVEYGSVAAVFGSPASVLEVIKGML